LELFHPPASLEIKPFFKPLASSGHPSKRLTGTHLLLGLEADQGKPWGQVAPVSWNVAREPAQCAFVT
jgi:hypothetical protein